MNKVIDTFLFFQELDLLEIRLTYLDEHVDKFVIVEACQTFSGKPKKFVFEENRDRFSKFIHKIIYYKIEDFHDSFNSVLQYLMTANTECHRKILSILEGHNHYPKKHLNWVLDTYHRECIHLAIESVAKDDDVIIVSDLDEIPLAKSLVRENLNTLCYEPRVFKQSEFRYFLNYYKDSEWLGSIIAKYRQIKFQSLNGLRIDSKSLHSVVNSEPIIGGYHFTSCGSVETIKEKIESWGHQEFNTNKVLKNIQNNIKKGQDIFSRETGTVLKKVSLLDEQYFDHKMASVISNYAPLISESQIEETSFSRMKDIFNKISLGIHKIRYKIVRRGK